MGNILKNDFLKINTGLTALLPGLYICIKFYNLYTPSSLGQLDQFSPEFTTYLLLKRHCQLVQTVLHQRTRWPPIRYGKKIKRLKIFSRTKKALRLNFGSNDDPRMTFDFSTTRSSLHPLTLLWGKCWKSFSENVLKTYGSNLLSYTPLPLDLFWMSSSLKPLEQFSTYFEWGLFFFFFFFFFLKKDINNLLKWLTPLNKMAVVRIYVYKKKKKEKKTHLRIFFSRTKKTLRLNLRVYHRGLKFYQVCLNDDPRMAFDFLT